MVNTVNNETHASGESGYTTQQTDLCRRVREAIILGHLTHGQRITEKFVADLMNVKRGPARESLLILEGQGLVRKIPSLGYFVESQTEEEIRDVYAVRLALETLAVRHAATHATSEHLVRLRLICDEEQAAFLRGDVEARMHSDLAFHAEIVRAANRRVIERAYSTLPRPFYGKVALPVTTMKRIVKQHEAIYMAIRSHDPDLAASLLIQHISEHNAEPVGEAE